MPVGLHAQLAAYRRRLWWLETLAAGLGALCGLLVVYVLLLGLDRFGDTPGWVRLVLLLGGVTACTVAAVYWFGRWAWRARDPRAMAVLVQRHYPRLGDRLLGVVELADNARRPANASAALCRAAMNQVARETAGLDFTQAASGRAARWWSIAAAVLVAGVIGVGLVWPEMARNAVLRLTRPLD
ncbi:hypothetical protein HQ590_04115, partial [bacterium]|nr:hypothetical protein [bacterium]